MDQGQASERGTMMRQILFIPLIFLLIASPATALTTSDCFDCHSDEDLTKTGAGVEVSLFIDETVFNQSIHGDMDCTDCHEDLMDAEDEHDEVLEPVQCGNCHDDFMEAMEQGVHSPEVARVKTDLPTCAHCHGKHDILPADNVRSSIYDLKVPSTCCQCHASEDFTSRHPGIEPDICSEYEAGMHGIVLIKSGVVFSAVCNDCHGSHDILPARNPSSRVSHTNINNTCGSCHAGIVETYNSSIHGKLLKEGAEEAPTCPSCHGNHRVDRAMDDKFLVSVTDRCSGCHPDEADTFRDTYHGQVTGMGYAQAAQCPNCHGAHDILPNEDPLSKIHPSNLVETCRACHSGAGVNFTMYMPHADYHDAQRFPYLYYLYLSMVILLSGVFTFFGIHTLLWFLRAQKEEKSKRA